jgi:TPR repeat protein
MKKIPVFSSSALLARMHVRVLTLFVLGFAVLCPLFLKAQSVSPAAKEPSRTDWKKLTKKAPSGNIESQLQLAMAYDFGKGVEPDKSEALRWYRKAADTGNPEAQANLGYLYETGPEAVRNVVEAGKWYMRAAVAGD